MRKEEQEEGRGGIEGEVWQFAGVRGRLWELDLKLGGKLCVPYVKFCKGGFHCAPILCVSVYVCMCVCVCVCVCVCAHVYVCLFSVSE